MMTIMDEPQFEGSLTCNEPMHKHTSWRVGGVADRYFKPANLQDLKKFLAQLSANEPLTWIGLGSNVLVRDGGIRGTVIATSGMLNELEVTQSHTVRAEVGVSCAKVARFCSRLGLAGAEFLAGIPGTMGGALAMNAGAFGGETWDIVNSVETISPSGECRRREKSEYNIGYRSVSGPQGEWYVAAYLCLSEGVAQESLDKIKSLLAKRADTQPTQLPNAGSVFRNPNGDFSARLIQAANLKGHCIGGACVSEKHANFIVNTGNASAADIEQLIEYVAQRVEQTQGVRLEREVRIVGEIVQAPSNN